METVVKMMIKKIKKRRMILTYYNRASQKTTKIQAQTQALK